MKAGSTDDIEAFTKYIPDFFHGPAGDRERHDAGSLHVLHIVVEKDPRDASQPVPQPQRRGLGSPSGRLSVLLKPSQGRGQSRQRRHVGRSRLEADGHLRRMKDQVASDARATHKDLSKSDFWRNVQATGPGRAVEGLVTRESNEVGAKVRRPYRDVTQRLRGIQQRHGAGILGLGQERGNVVNSTGDVGCMVDNNKTRTIAERLVESGPIDGEALVQSDDLDLDADALLQVVQRTEHGVVLGHGRDHKRARTERRAEHRQVQGVGGVRGQDDSIRMLDTEQTSKSPPAFGLSILTGGVRPPRMQRQTL